mmetsp:Transcript_30118/g.36952  ORF Transcript_30118/g.36952 Transcript_30118/m.36952 type:complete len:242 (-) Transcript_30118:47-772(-)
MHHLRSGRVDERATFGHLAQQRLVDGVFGLIGQGHMQTNILMIKELCHGAHRGGSRLLDLVRRDVWVICKALHTKTLCQLVHSTGHGTKAVEGDFTVHQFETAGAIVVVSSTRNHHTEDQLCHGICILSRCVHGGNALGLACFQVDVVVASTCADYDLQLARLVHNSLVHDVGANDHGIHICHGSQEILLALVVLQLLHGVVGRLENIFNLRHRARCEGLLGGQQHGPRLSGLARHGAVRI